MSMLENSSKPQNEVLAQSNILLGYLAGREVKKLQTPSLRAKSSFLWRLYALRNFASDKNVRRRILNTIYVIFSSF